MKDTVKKREITAPMNMSVPKPTNLCRPKRLVSFLFLRFWRKLLGINAYVLFLLDFLKMERQFEQALKEKKGFVIKKMAQDGACLFRAVGT